MVSLACYVHKHHEMRKVQHHENEDYLSHKDLWPCKTHGQLSPEEVQMQGMANLEYVLLRFGVRICVTIHRT